MELIVECANSKQAEDLEWSLGYWDHMDSRGSCLHWKRNENTFYIENYEGSPKQDFRKKGMKVKVKDWKEI